MKPDELPQRIKDILHTSAGFSREGCMRFATAADRVGREVLYEEFQKEFPYITVETMDRILECGRKPNSKTYQDYNLLRADILVAHDRYYSQRPPDSPPTGD